MLTRAAYLLESVRLEQPATIPPLQVFPVALQRGYGGRDLREVLNQELADAGFTTDIAPQSWGPQVAPRRRLAFAVCRRLETGDVRQALQAYSMLIARLTDLLALTHGGAPRAVGGVMELAQPDGTWRTLTILAGGGAWPGSALARLATDEQTIEQLSLPQLWEQPQRDPRVGVWLSLHRGIAAEPRWDVRMFRIFSLLEAIAKETTPAGQPLADRAGQSLVGYDGKPATSATARGRVYLLLERCLAALELADDPLRTHPDTRSGTRQASGWTCATPWHTKVTRSRRSAAPSRGASVVSSRPSSARRAAKAWRAAAYATPTRQAPPVS